MDFLNAPEKSFFISNNLEARFIPAKQLKVNIPKDACSFISEEDAMAKAL